VGWTIVLDVGKTLSKATLWDERGALRERRSRPNAAAAADGYSALDAAGIEMWLEGVMSEFAARGPVDAIVPAAHGAGAAIVRDNRLLCPPLDYEWPGVAAERELYDRQRDPFVNTGSPNLPAGLNLGVQLHWLESRNARLFGSGTILPWAQYWTWLLSDVAASELSSLGCHTDLWRPFARAPSALATRRGWSAQLAALTPAGATLGCLTSDWVRRTGLAPSVRVMCGLHDSNAAFLSARSHPDIQGADATILSTGTWFVAMRAAGAAGPLTAAELPETRDCLVNVDVSGAPVTSSRFMGGREIELLAGRKAAAAPVSGRSSTDSAIRAIEAGAMFLPAVVPDVGPFPAGTRRCVGDCGNRLHRTALAQVYAALVADTSLDLIGSRDCLIVEGRFSQAVVFVQTLAALRPTTQVWVSDADEGVAHGALRLLDRQPAHAPLRRIAPLPVQIDAYRQRWRELAATPADDATGD
jgi:sugar (pentulose or hexulose) kinase